MNSSFAFRWWRLELLFPPEIEESLIWKCSDLGINRFAVQFFPERPGATTLFVWLPAHEWNQEERDVLLASLLALVEPFGLRFDGVPSWEELTDEDWSSTWKKFWEPDPVGSQLLILPGWLDLPEKYADRLVIRMDPGSAFGTGSHPTTRLCLEQLDRCPPKDLKVADVGCGSGVLSLAALGLGAKKVFAVDTDSLAVGSTIHNSGLNSIESDFLRVGHGSVEVLLDQLEGEKVDLLLSNILASVLETLAPKFEQLISPNGKAILSGLLFDQISGFQMVLKGLGWVTLSLVEKDRWAMLLISRA